MHPFECDMKIQICAGDASNKELKKYFLCDFLFKNWTNDSCEAHGARLPVVVRWNSDKRDVEVAYVKPYETIKLICKRLGKMWDITVDYM